MPKLRQKLRAVDLLHAVLVQSLTGRIYRLGPPTKLTCRLNVIKHCQLYTPTGRLAKKGWYTLAQLHQAGFKLYQSVRNSPAVA
jgi:hypothetical protein